MKYILFLLLIVPYISNAQTKKDSRITVSCDTTNVLNKISIMLIERGFSIASKDPEIKFIESSEKTMERSSVIIRALVKDSSVIFTGKVASNITISFFGEKSERVFYDVYYGGMKGSDMRNAWEYIDQFAKQFGAVKYQK